MGARPKRDAAQPGDGKSAEQSIRAFLADEHAAQVAFLAEVVGVPSDNPPGECAIHAERTAAMLEELGFAVERHPVPQADVHRNGMVSVTNLVVRRKFGDGPVIALNAHGDVVPPGEGWTRDPYGAEIIDDALYGRGAATSKSDFATYAWALRALDAADAALAGTVELHFTYDEEVGGAVGPPWLLAQGISKPDYAISAGFAHGVVTAHNGCLHLEVQVRGRQAHAATPDAGIDALEAATGLLSVLYADRDRLKDRKSAVPGIDAPSLVVGLIEGGVNTNVVPDLVTLRLDRRLIPEEDPDAVEAELAGLIEGAVGRYPSAKCSVERILLARPLAPVDGVEDLADALTRRASQVMGEDVATHGVPIYTDARHYAEAGVPTVLYGAGPRTILEANAHAADEHLALDDLKKATEVVALALLDLLGGS